MTEYAVGDKVLCTPKPVTGTVTYVSRINNANGTQRFDVTTEAGDNRAEHNYQTITILEKAKPKVGDKIATREGLKALPVGSVVHGSNDRALGLLITNSGTRNHLGELWGFGKANVVHTGPYTVIYIPGE